MQLLPADSITHTTSRGFYFQIRANAAPTGPDFFAGLGYERGMRAAGLGGD